MPQGLYRLEKIDLKVYRAHQLYHMEETAHARSSEMGNSRAGMVIWLGQSKQRKISIR